MENRNLNLITELSVPMEMIQRRIYLIRGVKVIVDEDLAELYNVATGNLNLAIRRNRQRFPPDFMFQLTKTEFQDLILQTAISRWGGRRHQPYVLTEQGVAMLSSVLRSPRAIAVNIAIMRAFVKLREIMATHKDLARKIEELETKQENQGLEIKVIFKLIKNMLEKPTEPERKIGFRVD